MKYLSEDFKHRCAYCNLLDTQITTPYEADHFIPEDVFKDEWPELRTCMQIWYIPVKNVITQKVINMRAILQKES